MAAVLRILWTLFMSWVCFAYLAAGLAGWHEAMNVLDGFATRSGVVIGMVIGLLLLAAIWISGLKVIALFKSVSSESK